MSGAQCAVTRRRAVCALICVVSSACLLAACGSSSSSSTGSSATAGAKSTAAHHSSTPAGPAITIGALCSCGGTAVDEGPIDIDAFKAWSDSVNASGGINGYPVKLIVLDDNNNPGTSLTDVKRLVTQDHVKAIVGDLSQVDTVWASYVAAKGIPVIGGLSVQAPFLSNPDFFPSGTSLTALEYSFGLTVNKAGAKHLGAPYCAESPVCAEVAPLLQAVGKLTGIRVTTGPQSSTAPSYTAPCLQYKSEGVDALAPELPTATAQRFVDQCAAQGYRPKLVDYLGAASNGWFTDPNFQGMLLTSATANPFDTSIPAVAAFRNALAKVAPNDLSPSNYNGLAIYAWIAGELFVAAAKAAHITPSSTPADVTAGLYKLKAETLGGLTPPLSYTKGQPTFIPCYFTDLLKNDVPVSSNGGKVSCLTSTQVQQFITAITPHK
jgi:branched-chain amino acid transport system substrate-binding protein